MRWETAPLWTMLAIKSGAGFPHAHQGQSDGDYPFVKVGDLRRSTSQATNWVSAAVASELRASVVPSGSILMPKIGAALRVGRRAVADVPTCFDNNVMAFTPRSGDPRFWRYWAQQLEVEPMIQPGAVPSLDLRRVAEMPVPVPSLETKRRIADYLDTETARMDTLITKNTHAASLVEERFQRMVVSEIVDPPGDVPLPWADAGTTYDVGAYSMYGRTGSGHTPSRSNDEYWVDCTIPWVTTGDVGPLRPGFVEYIEDTAHKISRLGMANSAATLHPAGTVVLSRTASVGFAGIMAESMATSQDFFTWTPDGRLRSEYLLWSLRAMKFAGHFDRLMYGSTHKTIYVPDLLPLRGPVPPVSTQKAAVAAIREARDTTTVLLERLRTQHDLLAERRKALITAAVTGEIEV